MSEDSFTLPIELPDIKKAIPHRYPFLLLDRVVALSPLKSITAIKNISASDPILQGHFPDFPVFPGVLLVEALAQAAGVLGYYSLGNKELKEVLLTEVNNCRFRLKVVPGDQVVLTVNVTKHRSPFFWYEGIAEVNGKLAAKVDISAMMKV